MQEYANVTFIAIIMHTFICIIITTFLNTQTHTVVAKSDVQRNIDTLYLND